MTEREVFDVAGRQVVVTSPGKVYFPTAGYTKGDLVRYYLAVAPVLLPVIYDRPMVLKRYVHGADRPAFYQKRAPDPRPDWIDTATLSFPSGRTATEVVIHDAAQLAWIVNLGCIDLHPHPIRAADLDHPDELRVDLDPSPDVGWPEVRRVALVCREVLAEHGLVAWPKTSGSRGIHLNVGIDPVRGFDQVRRAALALAREVELRAPGLATSAWWKEERRGVFIDYNQNAKDRTTAGAYSVRPTPDARVSMPLDWSEVPDCDPAAFTLATVPGLVLARTNPWAGRPTATGSLDSLLALADRQAAAGAADAPWPPHFEKGEDEPTRAAPSRRRASKPATAGTTEPGSAAAPAARKRTSRTTPSDGTTAPAPAAPARRRPKRDTSALVTVARALLRDDALAGLERWKARHAALAAQLGPTAFLVDVMRGRSSTWTRVRVDLRSVPVAERPPPEAPDPDFDPRAAR